MLTPPSPPLTSSRFKFITGPDHHFQTTKNPLQNEMGLAQHRELQTEQRIDHFYQEQQSEMADIVIIYTVLMMDVLAACERFQQPI